MADYTTREGQRILAARYPTHFPPRMPTRFTGPPKVEALRSRLVKMYPSMAEQIDKDLGLSGPWQG